MTDGITIESFFLDDYKRVKERNEELEREIAEIRVQYSSENKNGGFVDLKSPVELVHVDTNLSKWNLFDEGKKLHDKNADQLREIASMDRDVLAEYLEEMSVNSYSYAIKVTERRFPFTLRLETYKGSRTFAYDPDYADDALIKFSSEADTCRWVVSDLKEQCLDYAVDEFRNVVNRRIEELEESTEGQEEQK